MLIRKLSYAPLQSWFDNVHVNVPSTLEHPLAEDTSTSIIASIQT